MSEPGERHRSPWLYVGVLTVLGLLLIWWAGEQYNEIRLGFGSEFQFPAVRLLLYLLTLVAAGVLIGQAVSPQREADSGARGAIAAWSVVPLVMIVLIYWTLVWPPGLGWIRGRLLVFMINQVTIVASCLVFGIFLSRLVPTPGYDR